MPKKSLPAAASGLPQDEVVVLGAQFEQSYNREEEIESKKLRSSYKLYLNNAWEHAADESERLRGSITTKKATTLPGAAIQIALAISELHCLLDTFEKTDFHQRRDARAIERLLFSALGVVDGEADQKLPPSLHNSHLNPWIPVEKRIAMVEESVQELAMGGANG